MNIFTIWLLVLRMLAEAPGCDEACDQGRKPCKCNNWRKP